MGVTASREGDGRVETPMQMTNCQYIAMPQDAGEGKPIVLIPSTAAADWSVTELGAEGGTRMVPVPMRTDRLAVHHTRPGDLEEAMDPPAEGHGQRTPIMPIIFTGSAKTDLEKKWDMTQLAYGGLLFGSPFYMTAVVQSMKDHPKALTVVLFIYGFLWCLNAIGFLVHLFAKNSKGLQHFTSIPPIVFLLAFPFLVATHIYYLIPNRKAALVFLIVKSSLLGGFYLIMVFVFIWKKCSMSLHPVQNISTPGHSGPLFSTASL